MQKTIKLLLLLLFVFCSPYAFSQTTTTVSGKVLSESGEELPTTTITVENAASGQKRSLVPGASGIFSISNLKINEKYNLYFEHVGYEPDSLMNYSLSSNENSSLLIRLKPEKNSLSEVVIIGYGQQRKANLTSSISTVDKKFLAERPGFCFDEDNAVSGSVPINRSRSSIL